MVASTDPVGDLNKAAAIVVAEGYATAATLEIPACEAGDPLRRVAFVAGLCMLGMVPSSTGGSRAAPGGDGHRRR